MPFSVRGKKKYRQFRAIRAYSASDGQRPRRRGFKVVEGSTDQAWRTPESDTASSLQGVLAVPSEFGSRKGPASVGLELPPHPKQTTNVETSDVDRWSSNGHFKKYGWD